MPEDNMIYHPEALSYTSHIATSGSELDPCACALMFSPSVPNKLLQLLRSQNLLKKAKLTTGLTSQFEDKRCLSSQTQIWLLGLLFARDRLGLTQLQAPRRGPGAPDGIQWETALLRTGSAHFPKSYSRQFKPCRLAGEGERRLLMVTLASEGTRETQPAHSPHLLRYVPSVSCH